MSVSIPDPHQLHEPGQATDVESKGQLVQLPLDAKARQRQRDRRSVLALRRHIALLSEHYAVDAARFQRRLDRARAATEHARGATQRARRRAAGAEAELFAIRGDLTFTQERLARERQRTERLAELVELPWWAFVRRRWTRASLNLDSES